MLAEPHQPRQCECRRSNDCEGAILTSKGYVVVIDGRPKFACPKCREFITRYRR